MMLGCALLPLLLAFVALVLASGVGALWSVYERQQTVIEAKVREEKLAAHGIELELLESPSLERDYAFAEAQDFFDELLGLIPANLQLSWNLRAEGHSYAKIAELTEGSESTAQRRFNTAKRRLEREYERKRRTPPKFCSPPKTAS